MFQEGGTPVSCLWSGQRHSWRVDERKSELIGVASGDLSTVVYNICTTSFIAGHHCTLNVHTHHSPYTTHTTSTS